MRFKLGKKAQSTLEYAVIIAVVVAALISMQIYFKRGLQGKIRQASDDIGEQFSPSTTTSNYDTNVVSNTHETVQGGVSTVSIAGENSQTRTGSESTGKFEDEYMP